MTTTSHVTVASAPEPQTLVRDVLLRDGATLLKADFAAPAHASDIDAVMLALDDESAVPSGWRELERRVRAAGREWIGAIAQRMVAPGGDVQVGAVSDPDLGPVLGVGFGGPRRRAGLGRTAAFRLLAVTDAEADELIDSAEGVATELDGFRGSAALDRQALRELMLRFALLLREVPLHPQLKDLLDEWVANRPAGLREPWLFIERGRRIGKQRVGDAVATVAHDAGIGRVTPHQYADLCVMPTTRGDVLPIEDVVVEKIGIIHCHLRARSMDYAGERRGGKRRPFLQIVVG
jgi:hypothetical protein